MTVVEFALITATCSTDFTRWRRPTFWVLVAAVQPLAQATFLAGRYTLDAIEVARPYMPLPRLEAKEYLPNDDLPAMLRGDEKALHDASAGPLIACMPESRLCKATKGPFGALTVDIEADRPTRVVLRRFFIPARRLADGPPLAPSARKCARGCCWFHRAHSVRLIPAERNVL